MGDRGSWRSPLLVSLAAALLVLMVLGGCGGPVEIASSRLDAAQQRACRDFVDALPTELADESAREISPDDAFGAAYGDPVIIVTCGAPIPPEFDRTQTCEVSNGVGWYVPSTVFDDPDADVTMTAVGYDPAVRLEIPGRYRPDGPAAAIAELADEVKEHLTLIEDCD